MSSKLASLVIAFVFTLSSVSAQTSTFDRDTFFVSDEYAIKITFPDRIFQVSPVEKEVSYRYPKVGQSVIFTATTANSKCATFVVNEGKRSHTLVLCYAKLKEQVMYDLSTTKKLQDFLTIINEKKRQASTAQSVTPTVIPTANVAVENSQAKKIKSLIQEGNKAFTEENWILAKAKYQEVLVLETDNYFATKGLADIEVKKRERSDGFKKSGDKLYKTGDFDKALEEYNKVFAYYPNDAYAGNMIKIIKQDKQAAEEKKAKEKQKQEIKDNEDKIRKYKSDADIAFKQGKLDNAVALYEEVLKIDPNNSFSRKQIEMIKRVAAQRAQEEKKKTEGQNKEETFTRLVSQADIAFANREYELANTSYLQAKDIKPNEPALSKKIAATKTELARIDRENKYYTAVTSGDAARSVGDYETAKGFYLQAGSIFADSSYPREQVTRMSVILDSVASQRKTDSLYKAVIGKADTELNSNDLSSAKETFKKASRLKPSEAYPGIKLTQIEDLLKTREDSISNDRSYSISVRKGDSASAEKEYSLAVQFYLDAIRHKSTKEVIERIERLNKKLKEPDVDMQYDSAMARGARYVEQGNFVLAKEYYKEAKRLKPSETYPVSLISFVDGRLQEEAIKQANLQSEIVNVQMEIYRNQFREAQHAQRDFEKAATRGDWEMCIYYLRRYLNIIPNDSVYNLIYNSNQYSDVNSVEDAKTRIEGYRKMLADKQKAGASYQPEVDSIPYLTEELEKKYEDINFATFPKEQQMDVVDTISGGETVKLSKQYMLDAPRLTLKDSVSGVKITCEAINFSGSRAFYKISIENNTNADFLTGQMYVVIKKHDGTLTNLYPFFISARPIVLPGKRFRICFGAKDIAIEKDDALFFEMHDRLEAKKFRIEIPGSVYLRERQRLAQ